MKKTDIQYNGTVILKERHKERFVKRKFKESERNQRSLPMLSGLQFYFYL
jgi:hypothetical protein